MSNLFEKVLDALRSLGKLPEDAVAARLQTAFLSTSSMATLKRYFSKPKEDLWKPWIDVGQPCVFDGVDRTAEVKQLGDASMAAVIAKTDGPWGFKTVCDADLALSEAEKLFFTFTSSLFAEHINHHLAEGQLPPLNELRSNSDVINGFKALAADGSSSIGNGNDPINALTLRFLVEYFAQGGIMTDPAVFDVDKPVSHIWTKWNENIQDHSPIAFWQQGIRGAESDSTATDGEDIPLESLQVTSRTTVYGADLAAWYASARHEPYMRPNSELNNIVHTTQTELVDPKLSDPIVEASLEDDTEISCLVAGTMIQTSRGQVPIEDVREGDELCTRLEPTQWGVRSSESVRNPAPGLIYGFNAEPAFFAAGHVFHTTTGLRAVRPDIARAANPWIEVGQLAVGHQLLRVAEGDRYESVLVESIHSESPKSEFVYGIHMREGLRSCHANGYLVALNYPEITVSTIAKRLATLSPKDRVAILSSFQELEPVFARFGAKTALEALDRETRSNNLSFGGKLVNKQELLTRDLDLPYIVSFVDKSVPEFQIELLHGVLTINGEFCEAASFNKASLAWTRRLPDGQFEHGYCNFTHNGQWARGYLARVLSDEVDNRDIANVAKAIRLVPGTLATPNAPNLATMAAAAAASTGSGNGTVLSASSAVRRAEIRPPTPPGVSRIPLILSLSYDPKPLQSGPPPNASTRCGNLIVPVENGHYAFPKLRWQDYDTVRDALTERIQAEQTDADEIMQMPDLYKHKVTYDINNREHHLFELLHSQALIEASDEYKAFKATPGFLDKEPPSRNLHYTNLGLPSTFQLAEVFQTISVQKSDSNPRGMITFTGIAHSYSSTSDGNQGAPHYIIGTYIRASTMTATTGSAMIESFASSKRDTTRAHIAPSSLVTATLAAVSDADTEAQLEALSTLPLNQSNINQTAQTMMLNVMQWHMNDADRRLFFNTADKPVGLPAEFTTLIQNTPTAIWLRDTYAKAYMCQVMSQNDANIRERYRFTQEEKKAARYFWEGKGVNCLSRSKIYHDLDRAISRRVIRQQHDIIGKIYDSGKGPQFSSDLYDWHTDDLTIDSLATVNQTTGTSLLTKICAIMDALDDGVAVTRTVEGSLGVNQRITDTNSNLLVYKSMANQKGSLFLNQYWGLKSNDAKVKVLETEWLRDALKDLVERILNQDPTITGPVSRALAEELAKYGEEVQGWSEMSTKEKAQQLSLLLGDRLPKMLEILAKTYGWVKQGANWVYQAGSRLIASWQQNTAAIGQAAEAVIEKEATGFLKGPAAKGFLVLVGMFAIGAMIWNFSDQWSGGSALDRATMITTVLMGFNQLGEFGVNAVYAVMRYRAGIFSEVAELAICTKFDRLMRTRLSTEWATVLTEAGPNSEVLLRGLTSAERSANPLGLNQIQAIGSETRELTVAESLTRLKEMAGVRRSFNIARNALSVIGYCLSIGIAIFLTWQLVSEWHRMDLGTRIFETIQVVLSCVEALGAAVVAGAYIAWGVVALAGASATAASIGAFAVAAASVFASFAVVIAGIAVGVLILYMIWQSKQEPPANAIETWMQTTGKPWTDANPSPPEPLTAYVSPNSVDYTSSVQTVRVGFTNTNTTPQTIEYMTVSFAGGPSPAAIFTYNQGFTISDQTIPGQVRLTSPWKGCKLESINHSTKVVEGDRNTILTITSSGPGSSFIVPAGGQVEVSMWGVIKADGGQPASISWTVGGTEEIWNGSLEIKRAKKP